MLFYFNLLLALSLAKYSFSESSEDEYMQQFDLQFSLNSGNGNEQSARRSDRVPMRTHHETKPTRTQESQPSKSHQESKPTKRQQEAQLSKSHGEHSNSSDQPVMRSHGKFGDALRIRMDPASKQLLRIQGATGADTLNFPYMAAIIINGRMWCAGAIVDVNWVLTAAHCLNYVLHVSPMKTLSKYVKIRVGSSKPHEGGMLVDVAGAIVHPKFEEEPPPHADIALLKLTENLEFGTHINLIKIYEGMKEPFAQSFVVVTGWGATNGHDTAFRDPTPNMLTARLKVRTKNYCTDAYQLVNGFMFTEDFFCASLRNGTRDVCLFDAGAPAVQQNHLVGILSFGPERCGQEHQPAVFIKAFYFRDFVMHTISSYKTTDDIIEAMKAIDPVIEHPVRLIINDENHAVSAWPDEITPPDQRHDK